MAHKLKFSTVNSQVVHLGLLLCYFMIVEHDALLLEVGGYMCVWFKCYVVLHLLPRLGFHFLTSRTNRCVAVYQKFHRYIAIRLCLFRIYSDSSVWLVVSSCPAACELHGSS